jgi:hypothetical protein
MKPTKEDYSSYLQFINKSVFGKEKLQLKQIETLKLNLLVRCRITEISEFDYKELIGLCVL